MLYALCLAGAFALWPDVYPVRRLAAIRGRPRFRRRPAFPRALLLALLTGLPIALLAGPVVGVSTAVGVWWLARRSRGSPPDDFGQAVSWDLLAACLRSGMPVPTAIRAVSADMSGAGGDAMRATADLLALGGDPVDAWAEAMVCPETADLARGARRSARSGAALAEVATGLAARVRERVADAAEARAQRAAVVLTAPLGLCFLPAFICLGIVPLVIGLAGRLSLPL